MIKKITLLLLFVVAFSWQGMAQITIGTGTQKKSVPINPYFGYSYSQNIYLASEISTSGNITELSFQFNGNSTISNSTDWVVYIGHTTKTEFTSTTDWVAAVDMTEVFNGTITVAGTGSDEWVTIDITDFAYNGTDNLVIAVDENTSGYDASSDDFYATAVTNDRSLYKSSDTVNSDPAAPVAGSKQAFIANVILGGLTVSNPPNCDATLTTTTNAPLADIAWSAATGAPTGYKLTVGTTSGGTDIVNAMDVGNVTSYTFASPLTGGTMYYATVTSYNANGDATGCSEQTFTTLTPPANDECSGAIALTVNTDLACGSVTSGTVEFATASSTDATACYGAENNDVWFSFVATGTAHQIKIQNKAGSALDMYNSVWEGTCGSLTLVAGSCSDPDTNSLTGLTAGNTYFVRVNTYGSADADTTFDICVGTPPPPPANDECSGAEMLTAQGNVADFASATVTAGTIASATDSGIAAPVCDSYTGTANDDVWYAFVATAADLNITVADAFDGVVELFSGSCGSLTHVDCKDSGANPEIAATGLTEGDTYYIRVYSYGTSVLSDPTFNIAVWTPNALGVANNAIAGFAYYPNPVNNQLSLRANNAIDQVEVLNILGQTVLTAKPSATSTAIDMTALNQGAYFVRVQVGDAIQTVKVIKN